MSAKIIFDHDNLMAAAVGSDNGITHAELKAFRPESLRAARLIADQRAAGKLPYIDLPTKTKDARIIIDRAMRAREQFDTVVVLGIGGSALGTIALRDALTNASHNFLPPKKRGGMKLLVLDNIDPDYFGETLDRLDLKNSVFNVISKSGSTAETAAQFLIVAQALKDRIGRNWTKHLIVTTDRSEGSARALADELRLDSFIVPAGVGGRFTVFSPVSLLPAACAGIDILALLAGARAARRSIDRAPGEAIESVAYRFGALSYLLDRKKGKRMIVMMPYSSKLYMISYWFRQLWAESLGKETAIDGATVNTGQTPINALGATDQHSQLQLYLEGPFDKVVLFIELTRFAREMKIPSLFSTYPAFEYLGGKSLNRLLSVEKESVAYALTKKNRPNMTFKLESASPEAIGALLFTLQSATSFAGALYNVDPYDQPGVELGKIFTYAALGRAGFEKEASAIAREMKK